MFKRKLSRKGQSTLEYAILILIVIVALLAMQTYLKRGIQGKMRESSDSIAEAYSPAYTTSTFTRTSASNTQETIEPTGITKTTINSREDDKVGDEAIPEYGNEYWP